LNDLGVTSWAKAWRSAIATQVRKQLKSATRLYSVRFSWWTTKLRPDMDTAAHQLIDSLTKDAFEINDNTVAEIHLYKYQSKEPHWEVVATYEV